MRTNRMLDRHNRCNRSHAAPSNTSALKKVKRSGEMSPINYVCKSRHFVLHLMSGFTAPRTDKAGARQRDPATVTRSVAHPSHVGPASRELSELILFGGDPCELNYFLPV